RGILGIAFQQIFTGAHPFYFPCVDESFNCLLLEAVILKWPASSQLVISVEPEVKESARRVGDAFAPACLPRLDRFAQRRNARARSQLRRNIEQAGSFVSDLLASRHTFKPLSS